MKFVSIELDRKSEMGLNRTSDSDGRIRLQQECRKSDELH
jgi:hypothetical protein